MQWLSLQPIEIDWCSTPLNIDNRRIGIFVETKYGERACGYEYIIKENRWMQTIKWHENIVSSHHNCIYDAKRKCVLVANRQGYLLELDLVKKSHRVLGYDCRFNWWPRILV